MAMAADLVIMEVALVEVALVEAASVEEVSMEVVSVEVEVSMEEAEAAAVCAKFLGTWCTCESGRGISCHVSIQAFRSAFV